MANTKTRIEKELEIQEALAGGPTEDTRIIRWFLAHITTANQFREFVDTDWVNHRRQYRPTPELRALHAG